MKNVGCVVSDGLCTSCGVCQGSCHKDAISFKYGTEINVPLVDATKCVNCGTCYDVCPGKGIRLNEFSSSIFGNEQSIQHDKYAGFFLDSYVGYSTNFDLRYHSATGGMVSQFLMYLLEKRIIDGAVVVRFNKDNPLVPEPFIATSAADILESRSSKYMVISMDEIAKEIVSQDNRKIVVVGLPCHIQGFRMLAKRNRIAKRNIIGFFSIYCSVNKIKSSLDYYLYRYGINRKNIGSFSFRDDGCMGVMKFCDKEGGTIKKIPYMSYWFGTHSFFVNSRCSLCIDQLGELADVSFGDIHIKPYSEDHIGTNSVIARSNFWNNKLLECKADGYIELLHIDISELNSSQVYTKTFKKGAGVKTNFLIRKFLGKKNPIYDYTSSSAIKLNNVIAEVIKCIMRAVGHHASLWFIIKALDKNKD